MKSIEIKEKLESVNKRLVELNGQRANQRSETTNIQIGFNQGLKSLSDLEAAKSRLATLEASISTIEQERNISQKEYEETVKAEERTALIEKAKPIVLEATEACSEYLEIKEQLNQAIGELGPKMIEALFKFYDKQREVKNLLPAEPIEIWGREAGLSKDAINCILQPNPYGDSLAYDSLLDTIQKELTNRRKFVAEIKAKARKSAEEHRYWVGQ